MSKPRKSWRTQEDSNLWPLPSEGLCNDGNEPFSVTTWLQTRFQAHVKPFFAQINTGLTPEPSRAFAERDSWITRRYQTTAANCGVAPDMARKQATDSRILAVGRKTDNAAILRELARAAMGVGL